MSEHASESRFTQADVDRFVAEERRKGQEKLDAVIGERDAALRERDETKALVATSDERIKAAEAESAKHEANARKFYTGLEKGLPLALAERLSGTTDEELAADADTLKALIPAPQSLGGGGGGEGLSGPTRPSEDKPTMNTLIRRAAGKED